MNTLSSFMVNRILEIRSALVCTSYGPAYFLPTAIVTVLKINKTGKLWFFARRCSGLAACDTVPVQARLQFFRRGKPFQVEIAGPVQLESDENQIAALTGFLTGPIPKGLESMVLVRMEISWIKYHESGRPCRIWRFLDYLSHTVSRLVHPLPVRNVRLEMDPM